jgi:hypothetical protein
MIPPEDTQRDTHAGSLIGDDPRPINAAMANTSGFLIIAGACFSNTTGYH